MMKTLSLAAIGMAWLFVGGVAQADHHEAKDPHKAFAQTDRDGNGQVDRAELHMRLVDLFFFVDLDKDGVVEREELEKVTLVEVDIARTDRNGDGLVSLNEFIESRFAMYDQVDRNDDGLLSLEEIIAASEQAEASP